VLLAAVLVLAAIYFTRRPYMLPSFLLKLTKRKRLQTQNGNGAVAFENPGYDREAQVHGLPGDRTGSSMTDGAANGSTSNGNAAGWEHPHLETPQDSPAPQRAGKYTQLT